MYATLISHASLAAMLLRSICDTFGDGTSATFDSDANGANLRIRLPEGRTVDAADVDALYHLIGHAKPRRTGRLWEWRRDDGLTIELVERAEDIEGRARTANGMVESSAAKLREVADAVLVNK